METPWISPRCLASRNSGISPAFLLANGILGSTKMGRWFQKAIRRHPSKFTCLINAVIGNCPITPIAGLEHAAQLEKPFAAAGVADAAADEEGAKGRFRQKSRGNVIGKLGAGGYAVHFSDLVGANGVDLFPTKRREGEQVVHVARAK